MKFFNSPKKKLHPLFSTLHSSYSGRNNEIGQLENLQYNFVSFTTGQGLEKWQVSMQTEEEPLRSYYNCGLSIFVECLTVKGLNGEWKLKHFWRFFCFVFRWAWPIPDFLRKWFGGIFSFKVFEECVIEVTWRMERETKETREFWREISLQLNFYVQ